jgi:putative phosphoesterase
VRDKINESAIDLGREPHARVVVVADSHSKLHPKALHWIQQLHPCAILHGGDIGELGVLDELESIAPTTAVRGNVDGRASRIPDHRLIDLSRQNVAVLRVFLTHIAVYGPRLRKDVRERARENQAQLVVCGHSHVPLITSDGALSVFNPGSLGPRRFSLPITFGVIEFAGDIPTLRHIDCETGETWLPPPSTI